MQLKLMIMMFIIMKHEFSYIFHGILNYDGLTSAKAVELPRLIFPIYPLIFHD